MFPLEQRCPKLKSDARGKNGMLSRCKCLCEQAEDNLAHIQAQSVQKVPGINNRSQHLNAPQNVKYGNYILTKRKQRHETNLL